MGGSSALAAKRRARGHTQETLAHRLGVDVSSIARWERGAAAPSPRVRAALAAELALSPEQLTELLPSTRDRSGEVRAQPRRGEPGRVEAPDLITDRWTTAERDTLISRLESSHTGVLTGEHAARVAHQWLITPAPPSLAEATEPEGHTRRLGGGTLERLHARLRYLHHADDVVAGGDLHGTIRRELAAAVPLLRSASYSEPTGRALLAAIAELSGLAAWSTADAGHNSTAEHYYLHGVRAAHAAAEPVLAAQLLSTLGYHLAETGGAPRDAVLVTRSALARLDSPDSTGHSATPSVWAVLHARAAWAHAAAGESKAASEQIQRARESYSRRTETDPNPDWIYWLTPGEMDIIVGRLDTVLGRPQRGKQRLGSALRHCDQRRVRETALYTTWLAHAHLRSHEPEHAGTLARRVGRLNDTIPSAYTERALTTLNHQLAEVDFSGG